MELEGQSFKLHLLYISAETERDGFSMQACMLRETDKITKLLGVEEAGEEMVSISARAFGFLHLVDKSSSEFKLRYNTSWFYYVFNYELMS